MEVRNAVFSSYTDGFQTCYRMSRSPEGPWIRPEVDSFDGRAFYAAKTGSDGKHRYIFGWNPTRGENYWKFDPDPKYGLDYASYNWGGAIVAHELVQHADGTLGTFPNEFLVNTCADKHSVCEANPLSGKWKAEMVEEKVSAENAIADAETGSSVTALGAPSEVMEISAHSPYGYADLISDSLPEEGVVEGEFSYSGTPSRFGIALRVDGHFDFGYYLMFEPSMNRIEFRSGVRQYESGGQMFPYAVELERPFRFEPGKTYHFRIFLDHTAGVLYLEDTALGFRMYNKAEGKLGLFAAYGDVKFRNLQIGKTE